MADTKISLFTDGVTANGTDRLAAARAGTNVYVTPAYIFTYGVGQAQTVSGVWTFGAAGAVSKLKIAGTTSGATTLDATAVAGTGTVILPTTGTLATLAGAEALTNKSLNGMTVTASTGTFTLTDAKTLAVSNSLTLAGTDSTTMTFPPASASIGYINVPSNSQSAAYTTVAADSGKAIDHPSTDANARTFTIDSNANVPYAVGTCITFTNMTAQVVTIAITADTMYLAGAGTTGSRSLAQYGVATARKLTTTTWLISGTGLT